MVGKSVLLKLLGHHIVHNEPGLEPIFVDWETRAHRGDIDYLKYLEKQSEVWKEQNEKIRPYKPSTKRIFLIDEAQDSYEENDLWQMLKNYRGGRNNALYVLVCVYGTDVVPTHRYANVESQARQMHFLQRVELRRTAPGIPCMLFARDEFDIVFDTFTELTGRTFEEGTVQYLFDISQGHPGIAGMLLDYLELHSPIHLSLNSLQRLLVRGDESFLKFLTVWGRGIWSFKSEDFVEKKLKNIEYRHLSMMQVKKALCEAAKPPEGLTRRQEDFDAFAFCHKMGLLHAEKPTTQGKETTFHFASPLHRKVAYHRLLGPELDALWPGFSLQQTCMHAISRFSPRAFRHRQRIAENGSWKLPEGAFQNEMYLCLTLELSHYPILAEHSNSEEGRIDFFVSDRMWGIEILQCGTYTTINEHVARFAPHGTESTSHLFHVVIEPDEFTAEFYTHDLKLLRSWSLGEGRTRLYKGDEFATEIKEPIPTQRELRMEMDGMRFRAEVAEEEAKAAAEEIRSLKEQLAQKEAKGAKESEPSVVSLKHEINIERYSPYGSGNGA
ncbi:MAG: hypothetical protein M1820_010769 [Bogoriella megaspora]|nr:MAG: hypothetical protein M1820_010769 [Bogoriella megaspora]